MLREEITGCFPHLIDRLLDEPTADWRETFETLDTETDELECIAAQSRRATGSGHADRQRTALDAFETATDSEGRDGN